VDPTGWLAVRSSATLDVADSSMGASSRRCTIPWAWSDPRLLPD
jgi:hypothetical protein